MSERVNPEDALREAAAHWTAPEPLRARVMNAAEPTVRSAVTWSDRAWFSTRWRLAAAFTVVAAFAVDLSLARAPASAAGSHETARATAEAVDEAARQAGLSADQARVFAQRAFALASRPDPEGGRELAGGRGGGEMK